MLAKTTCQHCGQHIEFEVEHAGSFIPCPNCAQQTRLIMPGTKLFEKKSEVTAIEPTRRECPCCSASISRRARACPECGEPFPDHVAGLVLDILAAVFFVTGGIWFLDGVTRSCDNIMQQTYCAERQSTGLCLMLGSLILGGLVRLIRK